MAEFDTGIIGGGIGGYSAALYKAKSGKSVVLFEQDKLGGTCLNRGCIPTKAFLHIADLYSELKTADNYGITCDNVSLNFEKACEYKNKVVSKLQRGLETVIKNAGITVIPAHAEIISQHIIKANNEEYTCHEIILAAGSKPKELKGLEFDHDFILSSDDILNLKKLPKSILIIGSGAIGAEWARIFSSFGVEVTVVELAQRLIPQADWEVSKRVERLFKMRGIKTYFPVTVDKINDKRAYLSNGEILEPECILAAAGRDAVKPETPFKFKCIGDMCGEIQLAHYAVSQAKEYVLNIPFDRNLVPFVIYGTPEIAWAGEICKTKEDDLKYDKILFPISALGKSQCDNSTDGFIKILAQNGMIKGASIISKEASGLIQQIIIAMQNNISVNELKQVCFAHPAYSEGILEGIMQL